MCDHLKPAYQKKKKNKLTHYNIEDGGNTILLPTYRTTQHPKDCYHCCVKMSKHIILQAHWQLQIDNYKLSNNLPMKIKLSNSVYSATLTQCLLCSHHFPLPTHMPQFHLSCWLNITWNTTVTFVFRQRKPFQHLLCPNYIHIYQVYV